MFENSLNVDLLSEEMSTCALHDDALSVKNKMENMDFDIMGVEDKDKIIGFVKQDELSNGRIEKFYKRFGTEDLISDSTSIIELLDLF